MEFDFERRLLCGSRGSVMGLAEASREMPSQDPHIKEMIVIPLL